MIQAVDAHACGEPGRVIVGGVLGVPGATMFDKMRYLQHHCDSLRKWMLREPRGYPAANCNLILPATHPDADAGFVIMEQVEYPCMLGTSTICVPPVRGQHGAGRAGRPAACPAGGSVKMCGGTCRPCRVWQAGVASGPLRNMHKGFICKCLWFQARSLLICGGWSLRRGLRLVGSAARGRKRKGVKAKGEAPDGGQEVGF
jgi:hypothetical protein